MRCTLLFVLLLSILWRIDATDEDDDAPDDQADQDEDGGEWEEEDPANDKSRAPPGMQTLSFKPANLTDEDQHSQHMPLELMCDGCRIIAFLMKRKLDKVQNRYKKGHKLQESDIIDLLDEVCQDKNSYDGYGVKEVKGKKRLSGEGLETKDEPGILQGGGRWPGRLHEMCEQYVGNLGEDAIYNYFLKNRSVETFLCYSEENGNVCNPKKKPKTTSTKKSKSKPKSKVEL